MRISRKGIKRDVKLTRTVLRPSTRGKNKRGICSHKATRYTKRPKAQLQTGYAPRPITAQSYSHRRFQ